ncbi:hypothetical protein J6590_061112 [Homalodisca vitripennis]|nr:hypothetical protein J6590_061112 [Homalodisca vitripennis]
MGGVSPSDCTNNAGCSLRFHCTGDGNMTAAIMPITVTMRGDRAPEPPGQGGPYRGACCRYGLCVQRTEAAIVLNFPKRILKENWIREHFTRLDEPYHLQTEMQDYHAYDKSTDHDVPFDYVGTEAWWSAILAWKIISPLFYRSPSHFRDIVPDRQKLIFPVPRVTGFANAQPISV